MTYEISQRFFFDAAHTLRREIEAEQSARIHGHTYHAEVAVCGEPDPGTGMVIDLGVLRQHVHALRDALDHRFLDEVPDLGLPTLENLCGFILRALEARGLRASRVTVWRDAIGDRCELRA